MAILNNENLPYSRVLSYGGDKRKVSFSVSQQESKNQAVLNIIEVELSDEDSALLADQITKVIYSFAKLKGYMIGDDV